MAELRDIEGFPGYKVGDDGQVYTFLQAHRMGERMTPIENDAGYLRVRLNCGPRKYKHIAIHTLVATTFHGAKPGPNYCVKHHGSKHDNRPENVYWAPRGNWRE